MALLLSQAWGRPSPGGQWAEDPRMLKLLSLAEERIEEMRPAELTSLLLAHKKYVAKMPRVHRSRRA